MMRRAVVLVGLLAAGCDRPPPGNGGQFGEEEGAQCVVVDRVPLGRDEVSPLGFAAGPLLDVIASEHVDEMLWASGESTALTLSVTEGSLIEHLTREVDLGEGETIASEIWLDCSDLVSMAVTLALQTEDGAFDESWETTLLASSADLAYQSLDLDEVSGSFDAWQHVPDGSDYDEVHAWLDLSFGSAGVSGTISGQGAGVTGDPQDPNSAAYAESFDIASFGSQDQ